MADLSRFRGWTALVTGASSGIGAEMARVLAGAGCKLVLVARREDKLRALADEIGGAEVVVADLGRPEGPGELEAALAERGLEVDLLVNNAGVGITRHFAADDRSSQLGMIQLNVTAVTDLTHRLLPGMVARRRGHVVLVGSVAAFAAVPRFGVYAATKAFVKHLGEALWFELRGSGVGVTVVHPGGTASEFDQRAGMVLSDSLRKTLMSSRAVAEIGLRAAAKGRRSVLTGWMNVLSAWVLWLLPTAITLRIGDTIYRKIEGPPT